MVPIFLIISVILSINLIKVSGQNMELTYVIVEERPALTRVGNVLEDSNIRDLVSPDRISDLRFSFLTEKNPQASYLWINSTSGELKTSSRINRESICHRLASCELRVQTVAQAQLGAFFTIIQVKVTVTDINDNAPMFTPSTFTIKVSEDQKPGIAFLLPTAVDPDMGSGNSVVGYSLEPSSAPFVLTVDGNGPSFDVRLRLDDNLDREATPSYLMIVLAVDGGNPTLSGTLTVKVEVIDVNDNSPVFAKQGYVANVSDSTAVDSVVAVVKATDLDIGENGLVRYILAPTQEDPVVLLMFYVNASSGEVRSKVSLDSYAERSYRLIIEAQDSAIEYKTARTDVVITIMDTHNSQPEILLSVFGVGKQAKVSEMAELGRVVAHVAVSEPDSSLSPNGQIACYLNNSDYFQLQAIVVKQFKVILTKRLDREQQTFHSVTVICEDSGSPPLNTSSNFIVEVEDENDNAPVFDPTHYTADVYEAQVRHGDDRRDVVLTVQASDRDSGLNSHLIYRLADGSDSDFGIYRNGSIVVTNSAGVDREDRMKGAVRKLTVLAVDSGKNSLTATANVVITIRDINDNPPKFSEPMYFFNVPENVPVDYIVSNVSATDADLESNAIFYFEMHKRDTSTVPFHVSRSGVIKVTGNVDREIKPNYEFRVIAYDLGEPTRLSSTVTVQIKVTDKNDNSPEFLFPNEENYTIYVPHTLGENTAFSSIIAVDRDEGRNGELVYARDSGNGSKFFDIETSSGQTVLVRPLTIKEIGLHIIVVVAHDRGVDIQMATQSIMHIVVYEGNATVPFQSDGIGLRNIIVVIVLVVVTLVLALAILLTILLIRRVDKQRRLYNAKAEETKADSNLMHLNPCPTSNLESPSSLSDLGDARDGGKKKKEVSFSLEDDSKINIPQTMITFNPSASDKYDAISESNRGNIKDDILSSNHYQADRQMKSSAAKKDISNFNYHLVHPSSTNGHKHKQTLEQAQQQDDNNSDVSRDSTSDSGRGGSDVELHSHGGVSKDSGDTSFASQRGFDTHNNLSAMSNGHNNNIISNVKVPAKSVHFQNIRPEPHGFGAMVSQNTPTTFSTRSPRSPILPGVPIHKNASGVSRYIPNVISEEGSFINLPSSVSGRCSNPSSKELEHHRNRIISDNFAIKPNNRNTTSINPAGNYTDMARIRTSISQRSNSNSCLDGAETWDGDTTTSGSYTVDAQELCDEIDKLFFDDFQDVVV